MHEIGLHPVAHHIAEPLGESHLHLAAVEHEAFELAHLSVGTCAAPYALTDNAAVAIVVVGGTAPEVGLHAFKYRFSVFLYREGVPVVDSHLHIARAAHHLFVARFQHFKASGCGRFFGKECATHCKLLMCEHVALGIKLSGFASLGYNVQSHLGAFPGFDFGQIESYLLLSLRSHIHGKVAVGSRLSIREKLPLKSVLGEVGEEVFVIHFDYAFCKVDGAEMHILVSLLHLGNLW